MDKPKRILIVDDDRLICTSIANVARTLGCEPSSALTLREGIGALEAEPYDVVFLDVNMPDGNGIDMIPRISRARGCPEVIVITAFGDPDSAEAALAKGAWEFIEKPFSMKELVGLMRDAIDYHANNREPERRIDFEKEGILGKSPRMQQCLSLLEKAVGSDANVLLTGETGTGKELFARAIHNNSSRAGNDFVVVDCAALPPTLVESILFGHEKGSYTGADRSQRGLVLQAHKGTLFLDEVGELPLSIQKKFLRILQEGRFRPVGKNTEVESDFRIISATNQDLDQLAQSGRFRKDLLFRLQALAIRLAPLRERPEDVGPLAEHYLDKICSKYGMKPKKLSDPCRDILVRYPWPGNVRELIHALESANAVARDNAVLVPKHLPQHIHVQVKRNSVGAGKKINATLPQDPAERYPSMREVRDEAIRDAEREYLKTLMLHTKGKVETACRISGLSRSRLYALLKQYDIS